MSRYRIVLRGRLSAHFESAFEGMALEPGPNQTVLVGDVRDQTHLYGLLDRLRDFGIELLAVERADTNERLLGTIPLSQHSRMRRVTFGRVPETVEGELPSGQADPPSAHSRGDMRTWIFRILVNIAKTRAVKEQRTTPLSSLASDEDAGPTVDSRRFRPRDDPECPGTWTSAGEPRLWETDPETGALSSELRNVVWAAVEALPGRQREVVVLRDVQGFGSEEACEILGLTAENQRVLLHRGRAKVRSALEAYYSGEIT